MRRISIILVFIMLSITVFGQDIIISFAGEGASTEITTVEVVNLANCTSIEVPGGSSLNLTTGTIVGVEEFENFESNTILSYPNPFENSTSIEFYVSQNDYVTVTVFDITGKIIADNSRELTAGVHSFEFTAKNSGIYFINVSGTNFVQSSKVICLSDNSKQAQLVYNEQVAGTKTERSYKSGNSKDFSFTEGDMLKLKGISGDYDYATVMVVSPTVSETYTFYFTACQDNDGNNYAVVEIGNQIWMAENIKTTSYLGGGDIPLVEDDTEWGNLEANDIDKAYCFYDNDENSVYGALYTYAAATNGDNGGTAVQGVCPTGWRVPSDAEWTELTTELGGLDVAGGKLKSTCMELWDDPNTGATNESGFTAIPGGYRDYNYGTFGAVGWFSIWWSATEVDGFDSYVWRRYVIFDLPNVDSHYADKSEGYSVRCIRLPQDDIIIDFAGEGASTEVTTIEVVNLSNCTSVEVPGESSLNLTTGEIISKVSKDNSKDFYFNIGDTLKLKGISGDYDYATVMVTEPTASETYTFNFVECTDGDGNNYAVVEIGEQTWMAESVKTTSYTNGDDIPLVESDWEDLGDNDTDKAYCFYYNNPAYGDIYGALYTYAAATNGDNGGTDVQGLCPTGWHVPSDAECTELTTELGGSDLAGGKLKSTCMELWDDPNIGTNGSGFTALPGGYCAGNDGFQNGLGYEVYFWSATESNTTEAWYLYLYNNSDNVGFYDFGKSNGFSVRCLLD